MVSVLPDFIDQTTFKIDETEPLASEVQAFIEFTYIPDGANQIIISASKIPSNFANQKLAFWLEANQEDGNVAHLLFTLQIYPEILADFIPDFGNDEEEEAVEPVVEEVVEEVEEEIIDDHHEEESTDAVDGNKIGPFKGWWQVKKDAAAVNGFIDSQVYIPPPIEIEPPPFKIKINRITRNSEINLGFNTPCVVPPFDDLPGRLLEDKHR